MIESGPNTMISPWKFFSQAKCDLSALRVFYEKVQCREFAFIFIQEGEKSSARQVTR